VAILLMLVEAGVSWRHERRLRARGAVEPPGDVYRAMQVAYPLGFFVLAAEGAFRGVPPGWFWMGAAVFALAKALKYWAIVTLGDRWCFRVLVPPDAVLIASGPYRFLNHPNYLAVAGELAGLALASGAWLTGPLVAAGFGWLTRQRIAVEDRCLRGGTFPARGGIGGTGSPRVPGATPRDRPARMGAAPANGAHDANDPAVDGRSPARSAADRQAGPAGR
jgi:methyltransferase